MIENMLKLDRTDLKILSILQESARITNQELANRIHLSPSSSLTRVRRLEESGIIKAYHASIDLNQLCRSIMCIATVSIQSQAKKDYSEFQNYISRVPEIIECFTVSGTFDFIMKVVSPDMNRYMAITDDLIDAVKAEITLNTHVVMNENKLYSGFPLNKLL